MSLIPEIVEYRGVSGLVAAEILTDDSTTYSTGSVFAVAGVAEISKTVNQSSEAHFYDNIAALVVESDATDTITVSASAIPLDVLAELTGDYYDSNLGALVTGNNQAKYFALGYQYKNTKGETFVCWRYKGTFSYPDATHRTEDSSTDANGQELVYTSIKTTHKFNGTNKGARALSMKESEYTEGFFSTVKTPDSFTVASGILNIDTTKYSYASTDHYINIDLEGLDTSLVSIDWGDGTVQTAPTESLHGTRMEEDPDAELGYILVEVDYYRYRHVYTEGQYQVKILCPTSSTWGFTEITGGTTGISPRQILTSVEFNNSLKRISLDQFRYSHYLESASFGSDSITSFPSGAFWESGLSSIDFPESVTDVGGAAFNESNLETVTIPSAVNLVRSVAFRRCDYLATVEIGAKDMRSGAFKNCTALEKVWIRETCTDISDYETADDAPFYGCPSTLVIYVEADSKPDGWHDYFDNVSESTKATVVYGQKTRPF